MLKSRGGTLSPNFAYLAFTLGVFVLVMAPLILWMWALAVGAFFTPFYAFLTNQRYVSRA